MTSHGGAKRHSFSKVSSTRSSRSSHEFKENSSSNHLIPASKDSRGHERKSSTGTPLRHFWGELTFVTETLVILWHPEGQEGKDMDRFLSNSSRFLKQKHDSDLRVLNISNESTKFISSYFDQITDHFWPDHLALPMDSLVGLVRKLQQLRVGGGGTSNTLLYGSCHPVLIYCQGDKGKLLLLLLCLLESLKKFQNSGLSKMEIEALTKYIGPLQHSHLSPSQFRYWDYFRHLITRQFVPQPVILFLNFITFRGVPQLHQSSIGSQVFFKLYALSSFSLQYISGVFFISHSLGTVSLKITPTQPIYGDILIRCYLVKSSAASSSSSASTTVTEESETIHELVFQCQFHVSAINCPVTSFGKRDLDEACNDARFPPGSFVELVVSDSKDFLSGDMDLGTVLPASNSLDSSKMLRQNSLKQLSVVAEFGANGKAASGITSTSTAKEKVSQSSAESDLSHANYGSSSCSQQPNVQSKDQSISKTSITENLQLAVGHNISNDNKNSAATLNIKSYNNLPKSYRQPVPIQSLPNYSRAGVNNFSSYKKPTEVISSNQTSSSNQFKSETLNDSSKSSSQYIKPLTLNWDDKSETNFNHFGSLKPGRPARESRVLSLEDLELSLQEELNSLKAVKNSAFKFPTNFASKTDSFIKQGQTKDDRDITSLSSLLSQIDEFVHSNCTNLLESSLTLSRNNFNTSRKISGNGNTFPGVNDPHFIDPLTLGALATFGSKPHKRSKSEEFLDQGLSIAPNEKDSINSDFDSNITGIATSASETGNSSPPKTKLQKFPSEHSTEVRTPQSEVPINQLNNTDLIFSSETPAHKISVASTLTDDLSDPIPKFPIEFNFDDILETKLEDVQFLDHDYSVPEPHSPVDTLNTLEENESEMPFISRLGFSKGSQSSQNNRRTSDGVAPISWRDVDPHTNYQKSLPSNPYSNHMTNNASYNSWGGLDRPNLYAPRAYQRRNDPLSYHNVVKERFSPSPTDRSQMVNPNFFASNNLVMNTRSPSTDDIAKRNMDLMHGYNNYMEPVPSNSSIKPIESRNNMNGNTFTKSKEASFDQHGNFISSCTTWLKDNNGGIIPWTSNNQHDQILYGAANNERISTHSSHSLSPKQGSFTPTVMRIDVPETPEKRYTEIQFTDKPDVQDWATNSRNEFSELPKTTNQAMKTFETPKNFLDKSDFNKLQNDDHKTNINQSENFPEKEYHKEKANQLKHDIKHHFQDIAPFKDWPNFNFSKDDTKTAEMYATLRRNRVANLSSSTSVPNISRQKSSDGLNNAASTDILNSNSGTLLKGNLDSLRTSMKNLLEGNEDVTLKERKEKIANLQSGGSLPDITWKALQKEKPDPFSVESDRGTLKKQPGETDNTLGSEGNHTMNREFSQAPTRNKTLFNYENNENSTLRKLRTENGLKKHNDGTNSGSQFDRKQERPPSPSSVTSWGSSVSRTNQNSGPFSSQQDATNHLLNKQQSNDIESILNQKGNTFVDENKINEAFRDQTNLGGPRQFRSYYTYGAKSVASNPSYAKPFPDSAAQRTQFTSTQEINQFPMSNSDMTSFNGRTRLGSRSEFLSDVDNSYPTQQRKLGTLASKSFSARDSSHSLNRNSNLRNPQQRDIGSLNNQGFHARSRSFSTTDNMENSWKSNRNQHPSNGDRAEVEMLFNSDGRNPFRNPSFSQEEFDKQVDELDNVCMEIENTVSSMLNSPDSTRDLTPTRQDSYPTIERQPFTSRSHFGNSKKRRPSLTKGGPPVASSALFHRTLSPNRTESGDSSQYPLRSPSLQKVWGANFGSDMQLETDNGGFGMGQGYNKFNSLNRSDLMRGRQHRRNMGALSHMENNSGMSFSTFGDRSMSSRARSMDQMPYSEGDGQYFNARENPTSPSWYQPKISRDAVIDSLKDQPCGSFLVRDSNTYPGSFALAIKVETPPPGKGNNMGPEDTVRHYLIEKDKKGYRVKGHPAEQYFDELTTLINMHTLQPVSLPCKLVFAQNNYDTPHTSPPPIQKPMRSHPNKPPVTKRSTSLIRDRSAVGPPGFLPLNSSVTSIPSSVNSASLLAPRYDLDNISLASSNCSTASSMQNSAACLVLYVSYTCVESLTGDEALMKGSVDPEIVADPVILKIKVNPKGITLTDTKSRLFSRKSIPLESVVFCSNDPRGSPLRVLQQHPSSTSSPMNTDPAVAQFHIRQSEVFEKRCFGIVVKEDSQNYTWLLAEYEADQPVSAIVNFINKTRAAFLPTTPYS